jgi:hypothetical protein
MVGVLALSSIVWLANTARADGCEAYFISPCQTSAPSWWLQWNQMSDKCGAESVPQQDPFLGDYWTTGCGGSQMIWESWVWCVTPPM